MNKVHNILIHTLSLDQNYISQPEKKIFHLFH